MKVTPAHDPNDFQAGLRHNLPQIDVMDEHAHMNAECRAVCGLEPLRGARARARRSRSAGTFWSARRTTPSRSASATAAEPSSSRGFRRSGSSRSSRWPIVRSRSSRTARSRIVPENYQQIYLNWMHNIHDWCISRQLWWGHRIPAWHCKCGEDDRCARDAGEVLEVRQARN